MGIYPQDIIVHTNEEAGFEARTYKQVCACATAFVTYPRSAACLLGGCTAIAGVLKAALKKCRAEDTIAQGFEAFSRDTIASLLSIRCKFLLPKSILVV
ncbi:hypothetical protein KM043_012712 [Ampulex compressa]|nr:hypothetical protein KM043_012712 [Ampulex compressa]